MILHGGRAVTSMGMSACYYPSTVLLVDDDPSYLRAIRLMLQKKTAIYKLFDHPIDALDYLVKTYKFDPFTNRSILRPEEDERGHRNIDINLLAIPDEIFNAHRFDQISVIVVDQEMPGMKGLDICSQLKASPIKKLMLTGEVKGEQAINAFNNGVIDKFVSKGADSFADTLNREIQSLQKSYFESLSSIVINSLTHDAAHHPLSCLDDPVFIRFFREFLLKHNVVEYYLSDANGSFMFLDFDGNPSWFVVKNEEEMEATYFDAEIADKSPSSEVMESLKNKEKILYLHTDDDYYLDANDWEKSSKLHPAKKLEGGKQVYYYAYIDDPDAYDIGKDKILSFRGYLDKLS